MVWCSCPLLNLPLLTSNPAQWSPPAALIFPSPLPQTLLYDLVFLWLNLPPLFPLSSSLCTSQSSEVRENLSEGPMLVISRHIWYQKQIFLKNSSNPCTSNPVWLHPPCDPKACVVHQTKQHKHQTKLDSRVKAALQSSSITVSVSSHWSTLLISLSLALFPSLSLSPHPPSLFYSHVAPAIKWLHEEF